MTRLGQPPDHEDLAEEAENRRLAGLTPLSHLNPPPGVETIREAAPADTVATAVKDIGEAEQAAAQLVQVVPAAFKREHYIKVGLAVAGAVAGAIFAIVDPALQPIAIAISGGSVLFGGAEVNAHSKGP